MIAILDYGSGNLRSAQRAFALSGHETIVTSDPKICLKAEGLVIPGVGAYSSCMKQLLAAHGDEIIQERVTFDKPLIGICVGMQILFSSGSEKGEHAGLGLLTGSVTELVAPILPHIGWNNVQSAADSQLFKGLENESFYFVHSFAAKNEVRGAINSWCTYTDTFLAAVEIGAISAVQFHPEKSGVVGAKLISNWVQTL